MEHIDTDHIINFLARIESPEDIKKLKEWLEADSTHRSELKEWLAAWDSVVIVDAGKLKYEEAYQRFMLRLKEETTAVNRNAKKNRMTNLARSIGRIAAVFVVSFSLGILCHFYWIKNQHREVAFIENIVPLGSKSKINLPDGSSVWLNAGSTIRYATDFGRNSRDVHLVGEGYFKVAKQNQNPFIVHTSMMKVKALGTEFNVKAYPEENKTETTLVSGKVVIDNEDDQSLINNPIVLAPGQKFSVSAITDNKIDETEQTKQEDSSFTIKDKNQPPLIVKQLSSATVFAEISWKERNWRIESEPLQDLAVKLDRRYDVHIQMDEQLKNYRFTGTIKDESLEQVLHAMQLTAPIQFKVDGKIVSIHIDPNKIK